MSKILSQTLNHFPQISKIHSYMKIWPMSRSITVAQFGNVVKNAIENQWDLSRRVGKATP